MIYLLPSSKALAAAVLAQTFFFSTACAQDAASNVDGTTTAGE